MPRINRIRIANISYDGKYIMDETYDSYDGENMLINLKNGSGKSVLVQLMLQPVNPCSVLHGRKMESYLETQRPSFIFVEWKLDNTPVPTYFLTGIVMIKAVANENNVSKIQYFTFTNRYIEACEFDIAHIPFIVRNGNGVAFESYAKCREIIKANVKSGSDFDYFSFENKDIYKEKLAENGIYCNEWETIADCNEKESGISEMFNGIKTSDKLFDDWILKTIVNNTKLGENLHNMFEALIDDINANEDIIRQKEIFDKFLDDVDGYTEKLSELIDYFDKIDGQQKYIADVHDFLVNKENIAETNITECKSALELNAEQFKMLEYEKLSDEYHTAHDSYQEACDNLITASVETEKAQNEYNDAKKQVDILNAIELYNEYKKTKGYADAKRQELTALDKGEDNSRYNNLVYTLINKYSGQLQAAEEQILTCNENINKISDNIQNFKIEKDKLSKDIEALSKEEGKLEANIKHFNEYEKNVFEELGISLIRNLMDEYDSEDIEDVEKKLEAELIDLNRQLEDNHKQTEQLKEKKETLGNESISLSNQNEELFSQFYGVKNELTVYEQTKEDALEALRFFELNENGLFDAEANFISIGIQESKIKKKCEDYRKEYHSLSDYRDAIFKGAAHISPEFTKILEDNGIKFDIGEDYLNQEPEQRKTQLIQNNPLLPFCYIVENKDYAKIKELTFNDSINKVIPIITYDDIQNINSSKPKIAELNDKNMFVCLYNEDCIDEDKKKRYIEKLDRDIENINQNIMSIEKELTEFKKYEDNLRLFDYSSTFYNLKCKERDDIDNNIKSNKDRISDIQSETNEVADSIGKLGDLESDIKGKINTGRKKQERFCEYKDKNTAFIIDQRRLNEVQSKVSQNNNRNIAIDNEITELDADKKKSEKIADQLNANYNEVERKLSNLDENVSGELLDVSVEQMEIELESVLSERRNSIEDIKNSIRENEENAEKFYKKLKKLDVSEDEYTNSDVIFSDKLLEMAEKKEEDKKNILSDLQEEEKNIEVEKGRLKGIFETTAINLKKAGYTIPLDISRIKRNYFERENELEEKKLIIKQRLDENKQLARLCRDKYNQLKGVFEQASGKGTFTTDNIEEINPPELKGNLERLKNEKNRMFKSLSETYSRIGKNYSNCEYIVIQDFIGNMNPYNVSDFDNSFDILARVQTCKDCLVSELDIVKNTLENIEKQKTLFVKQAIEQGKKIYSEVKDMSNLSRVKIDGKQRQMLSIGIPDKTDDDCENTMKQRLDKFLLELRSMATDDSNIKQKIRQNIEKTFSNRELLNIVIGQRHIPVSLYKVDAMGKSGALRTWEEVRVENSGAQLFVATFSFISTIIDYERRKIAESRGRTDTFSKVFIIDNPFGTTSSKPFLDAMTSVAEKFNLQLICLSDLSQSSITNQFNVIHQLVLRTPLYGNKEYLKTSKSIINGNVHRNGKLEHISMKMEQMLLY